MKIGVVGIPGGWSSEKLADTVADKTGHRLLIDLRETTCDLQKGKVLHNDIDLLSCDALIIKKIGPKYSPDLLNRLDILKFCEQKGTLCFSGITPIIRSFSRLSGTLNLIAGDIPMPPTTITESPETAASAIEKYGRAILKPLFSTKARGMVVVNKGEPDIIEKLRNFQNNGNTTMYIQKMVNIPGKDLGVAFLGGKYLATYARVAGGDSWNTTIHSGGRYEPFTPGKEILELAHRAQEIFGLDFTSVDIVETEDGPLVFEVSAFGGFRGLLEANNINAAELYTDYVTGRLKNENL